VNGHELGFSATQLCEAMGAFALYQRQKRFSQQLSALCQSTDFLGLRKQLVVQCQCSSHDENPLGIKSRIILFLK
jgi:hypothetical protein